MAELSRARGIAGVIINAGVRDIASLREMPFTAWSKVILAEGAGKSNPGWANVPSSAASNASVRATLS